MTDHLIPAVLVRRQRSGRSCLLLPTAAALFAVKELSGLLTMLVEAHRDNMGRILGGSNHMHLTFRRYTVLLLSRM